MKLSSSREWGIPTSSTLYVWESVVVVRVASWPVTRIDRSHREAVRNALARCTATVVTVLIECASLPDEGELQSLLVMLLLRLPYSRPIEANLPISRPILEVNLSVGPKKQRTFTDETDCILKRSGLPERLRALLQELQVLVRTPSRGVGRLSIRADARPALATS